ncbi:MAG: hypothetical protein BGO78_04095 [Chloroflexi bacterium 44-23]|nr:MAG: hypothetical protein BGO78_04095 [Chloroflexi bacterium 44-23]
MSTTFCMIRHGQTDWNLQRRYQGQIDIPLNSKGLLQAKNAFLTLQGQVFEALYSSDLQRALQTAAEIGRAVNLPVLTDKRLREIHQGDWEGQLIDEVFLTDPDGVNAVYTDPHSIGRPGGESILIVAERVQLCLTDLSMLYNHHKVLVVSHGLAIATAICISRKIPLAETRKYIPNNCELTEIQFPYADDLVNYEKL